MHSISINCPPWNKCICYWSGGVSDKGQTDTLPVSSSNLVSFWYFMLFEYSCWNLFEFLFWSTVLMKWELFPRHWNPGKGVWDHFVEQTNCVPPTLMRTAGFVRQEEWLESFCFLFLFLKVLILPFFFFGSWLAFWTAWGSQEVQLHARKSTICFSLSPVPLNPPFAGGHYALLWVVTV